MADWLTMAGAGGGNAYAQNTTRSSPPAGLLYNTTTENRVQVMARGSYTWSRLHVNVTANTANVAATVTSRKNTGPGNQSITVGAGLTGLFYDDTNSDSLVDGDVFNCQVALPAGAGSCTVSIMASALNAATGIPLLAIMATASVQGFGVTGYYAVGGELTRISSELFTQYTFRAASTLSNLRARVSANTLNGNCVVLCRKNVNNGNQLLTIGAGLTGAFEDAVNTDTVAVADEVDYQSVTTAATAGSLTFTYLEMKSASTARPLISYAIVAVTFNVSRYFTPEGDNAQVTAEANSQTQARIAFVAKNLFANVGTNTLNGAAVVRLRKNTNNGNLNLSVGAAATGLFEDNTNQDSIAATDLLDYLVNTTAAAAGSITQQVLATELNQPSGVSPARTGTVPILVRGMGVN